MAKTFIGQLLMRVRAEGLQEGDRVISMVNRVENALNNMRATGVPDWGLRFDKALRDAKFTREEIDGVRTAWVRLHDDLKRNKLSPADSKKETESWKDGMLRDLGLVKNAWDTHHKEVLDGRRRFFTDMDAVTRAGLVALGGYTAAYVAGMMAGEAFRAASEERRQMAEGKYAGLSDDERGRIDARADELAQKYRLSKASVLESLKDSTLSLPSVEEAIAVSDAKARALLLLSNTFGKGQAIDGLRGFDRAMDNIEKIQPDEYLRMLDSYMRMQQVLGKDVSPEGFEQAVKYSRIAGKVGSEEFVTQYLPLLMSQIGGMNAGSQTRAFFDQFVVGRASKASLAQQRIYGLRDASGVLLNEQQFGENPILWIYDTLLPQLQKSGVDTANEVELARIVGALTNNVRSADLIISSILNMEQWSRIINERFPNAKGLAAADDVQADNPFAAFEGFKDALRNLSAALLPMESVAAMLNTLADGINNLAAAGRTDPLGTGLLVGGGLYGAFQGGKFLFNKAADMFGLASAATALHGSAGALVNAAVAIGGKGVVPGGVLPGGKGPGKPGAGLPLGTLGFGLLGTIMTGQQLLQEQAQMDQDMANGMSEAEAAQAAFRRAKARGDALNQTYAPFAPKNWAPYTSPKAGPHNLSAREAEILQQRAMAGYEEYGASRSASRPPNRINWHKFLLGAAAEPDFDFKKQFQIDAGITGSKRPKLDAADLQSQADTAAADLQQTLSVTAAPTVDSTSIDAAIVKAQRLVSLLKGASAAATAANSNAGAALRRNFADMGVGPQ